MIFWIILRTCRRAVIIGQHLSGSLLLDVVQFVEVLSFYIVDVIGLLRVFRGGLGGVALVATTLLLKLELIVFGRGSKLFLVSLLWKHLASLDIEIRLNVAQGLIYKVLRSTHCIGL